MSDKKNKSNKPKKKKLRFKSWVWIVVALISLGALIYSSLHIFLWSKDNKETREQIEDLGENKVEEIPADDKDELVNPPDASVEDDYWKYIKLPLYSVDFNELKALNSDTVAYLKVNGTTINYPVVQAEDNSYYLNRSFNKTINGAGWVFMDYRNNIKDLDANTIIYAHGRMDTTMFGSLKNIVKNNWYENTDNYVVNLSTEAENTLWQVFSVYKIKTETYYLTTNFGTDEAQQKFLDTLKGRSIYDFKTTVQAGDKILTLSTCYNDQEKVVLHAKLIKRQAR